MKKTKKPTKRNPIAKASSKLRTKVVKSKKNYPVPGDIPSTGNYNYNSTNLFGGE
jgi:hypothetical protein